MRHLTLSAGLAAAVLLTAALARPAACDAFYGWGDNSAGQLGAAANPALFPTRLDGSEHWQRVAAGRSHTLGILYNAATGQATLWAWGENTFGQLGIGGTQSQSVPQQVGTATDWVAVAAGDNHSLGIRRNPTSGVATLWAWGSNDHGQLGLPGASGQDTPQQVTTLAGWAAISAGRNFSLAIRQDAATGDRLLLGWGDNSDGQLGTGDTANSPYASPVLLGTDWVAVSAGTNFAVGIRRDRVTGARTLWAWGNNQNGQLGQGALDNLVHPAPVQVLPDTTDWAAVSASAGGYHCLAIRKDATSGSRTLWGWGRNTHLQLGDGRPANDPTPGLVNDATDWYTVAAGANHSMGLRGSPANGGTSLWAWGQNNYGQLGSGDTRNQGAPVMVGQGCPWSLLAAGPNWSAGLAGGDMTAPNTSATLSPAPPSGLMSGWLNEDTSVVLEATDNVFGTGVASITYQLDDAAPITVDGETATVPVQGEGIHTLCYYASDYAGNAETVHTIEVKIDKTAPGPTACAVDGPTISLSSTDALSGVDYITYSLDNAPATTYTAPVSIGLGAHTVVYHAVDKAGNPEPPKTTVLADRRLATWLWVRQISGYPGETFQIAGQLIRTSDQTPIAGRSIDFSIGDWTGTATTDATGYACLNFTIPAGLAIGTVVPIDASFADGDSTYLPAVGVRSLTVTRAKTWVWVRPISGAPGQTFQLAACLLRTSDGMHVAGKQLTFTIGTWSASVTTNATGYAYANYTIPAGLSTGDVVPITVTFADGDSVYQPGTGSSNMTVMALP